MKSGLLIVVLILISINGKSQVTTNSINREKFVYGVNTGLNISKFSNDTIDFKYGTNPLFGLFGKYQFSEKFYLKSSVSYSIRSSKSVMPFLKLKKPILGF